MLYYDDDGSLKRVNLRWMADRWARREGVGGAVEAFPMMLESLASIKASRSTAYMWFRVNSMPVKEADTFGRELGVSRELFHDPWGRTGQSASIMSDREMVAFWESLGL